MGNGTYHRYAVDSTGINPDNLVAGEEHSLTNRELRFVIPMHAPFFSEHVAVYDAVTNRVLTKTTKDVQGQYTIPLISQEATLKFGLEVADGILITDPTVSSSVRITYQAVGGVFQNNISNVVNIFETFLNDNRAIDWTTGIYGKPNYYPPGEHPHHIVDIFGFESMSFMLERIYQAILLGHVPAYEMIFEALRNNSASKEDIDNGIVNNKLVPLDVLQYASNRYNFNQVTLTPMETLAGNGKIVHYDVTESNAPLQDRLYWTIEHITSSPEDFVLNSGSFQLFKGRGSFQVQTALDFYPEDNETFKIVIHRGGPDRYVLLTSHEMTLKAHSSYYQTRLLEAMRVSCLGSPRIKRTAKVHAVNRGIWKSPQS